jgi:hypothetical protein
MILSYDANLGRMEFSERTTAKNYSRSALTMTKTKIQ